MPTKRRQRSKQGNEQTLCRYTRNLEKLDELWKHGNHEAREKLIIYDAVIRTKLMYGIESLQLNQDQLKKLDTFQLKGMRQILKKTQQHTDKCKKDKNPPGTMAESSTSSTAQSTHQQP